MFLLIAVFLRMITRALISILSRMSTYPSGQNIKQVLLSNKPGPYPLPPPLFYLTEIDGMQGQPVSIATSSITFFKL